MIIKILSHFELLLKRPLEFSTHNSLEGKQGGGQESLLPSVVCG